MRSATEPEADEAGWLTYGVDNSLDVFTLRRALSAHAIEAGFHRHEVGRLAIVATELCTNILKHAQRGHVRFRCVQDAGPARIEIEAEDGGPPIDCFESAAADGSDARGPLDPAAYGGRRGIGAGLGAIRRLSSELRYRRSDDRNHFSVLLLRGR